MSVFTRKVMAHKGAGIVLSNGLASTVYCHHSNNRKQLERVFIKSERKLYPTQIMLPGCPWNDFMVEVQIGNEIIHLVCYDGAGAQHFCTELGKDVTVLHKKYLDAIVYNDVAYLGKEPAGKLLLTAIIKKISPAVAFLLSSNPRVINKLDPLENSLKGAMIKCC